MAMIKCPECGAEISTRAVSCVKCGLPMSEIYICPECGEARPYVANAGVPLRIIHM